MIQNKGKWTAALLATAMSIAMGLGIKWEGGPCLTAYQDVTGTWTICYGHTKGVRAGDHATLGQCNAWLEQEMAQAQRTVLSCIEYPMTTNQLGALTSGTYNVGPRLVCGSTLQRLANAGDMKGACEQLTQAKNGKGEPRGWAYSAGRWFRGLFNRRVDEQNVCWPSWGNVVAGAGL